MKKEKSKEKNKNVEKNKIAIGKAFTKIMAAILVVMMIAATSATLIYSLI